MVVGVTAAAELGALRHIDDAKRAAAMALVREGRLFDLGRELHEGIPVFPGRHFRQTLVPNPGPALGRQLRGLEPRGRQHDDAARHAPRRPLPPADG